MELIFVDLEVTKYDSKLRTNFVATTVISHGVHSSPQKFKEGHDKDHQSNLTQPYQYGPPSNPIKFHQLTVSDEILVLQIVMARGEQSHPKYLLSVSLYTPNNKT